MIGILDVGGGCRAAFASGVFDYLIDNNIKLDYVIGVSAGTVNGVSYIAGDKGRAMRYYTKYNISSRASGWLSWLHMGGKYIDMKYLFYKISAEGGIDPLSFDTFENSDTYLRIVSTDSATGEPLYFGKEDLSRSNFDAVCASSALPGMCRPFPYKGHICFDGCVSDPVPVDKAFEDGCDKLIVLLAAPKNRRSSNKPDNPTARKMRKRFPAIADKLENGGTIYNRELDRVLELEKEGKVLVLCPSGKTKVSVFEHDTDKTWALHDEGYKEAEKIKEFIGIK